MHPPFTHGHYKLVPPAGDTVCGVYLPAGTGVGHNIAAITRKEAIFGDDVEVFRPERFLECSKEKRNEMDRAIDAAFGGGRWTCAGRTVAEMELHKLTFEVRDRFFLVLSYTRLT
jgi:cytochrome P450